MTDLYLRFANEVEAVFALYELPTRFDSEGNTISAELGFTADGKPDIAEARAKFRNIDTIGVISKRTGGTDEEPVFTALTGWHVNVRALADEDVSGLEAFVTNPATPVRVWA